MTIHVPPQLPSGTFNGLAFVGEAPSDEELEKGRPLVGPAGRIHDALLRTAGIERAHCWTGNVFDEQLPYNNADNWCAAGLAPWEYPPLGKAGHLRPEHRWHLKRLSDELSAIEPTAIVPMGATALWAFTGRTDISLCRGAVMEATHTLPGTKLLPTYHAAFVMRQWKYYTVVATDLERAQADVRTNGARIVWPKRRLLVQPTYADVLAACKAGREAPLLSVDIETGWGQITCIGWSWSEEEAICVPFVDLEQPDKSYWRTPGEEYAVWLAVKGLLESPVPKLGQFFGMYDFYWLLDKWGIRVANLLHDTRLLHHALYPELPKDLAFLGSSYTKQGAWKLWKPGGSKKEDD